LFGLVIIPALSLEKNRIKAESVSVVRVGLDSAFVEALHLVVVPAQTTRGASVIGLAPVAG
jgi:hypothetical protein